MKILAICSSIDLSVPGGGVPIWWQMLKSFHEAGAEVVVTTCLGKSFASPWWRSFQKPFTKVQDSIFFYGLDRGPSISKNLFKHFFEQRWQQHLTNILTEEKDIDILFLMSLPRLAEKIPPWARSKFQIPTVYYESDIQNIPKYSLDHRPEKHRFPNLAECDAVVCSFEKTSEEFREKGIQKVKTIPFGADPMIFAPVEIGQDIDVFFSGYGALDREDWISRMIAIPSKILSKARFVVEGTFKVDLGLAERIHSVSLDRYMHLCCRSKINLNILRQQFIDAEVLNSRIFELASLECCVVSNPCKSLQQFFEVNKEVLVAKDDKEAVEIYKWLISSEEERTAIGKSARRKILKEHTYLHRAREFLRLFKDLTLK